MLVCRVSCLSTFSLSGRGSVLVGGLVGSFLNFPVVRLENVGRT